MDKKFIEKNKNPVLEIIEETDYLNADEKEKYWIKYYDDLGCKLTNMNNGGKGWPKNFSKYRDLDMNLMKTRFFLYYKFKTELSQGIRNYIETIYGINYKKYLETDQNNIEINNFIDKLKRLKNPFTKMEEEEIDEIYNDYVMDGMFSLEFMENIWEKIL